MLPSVTTTASGKCLSELSCSITSVSHANHKKGWLASFPCGLLQYEHSDAVRRVIDSRDVALRNLQLKTFQRQVNLNNCTIKHVNRVVPFPNSLCLGHCHHPKDLYWLTPTSSMWGCTTGLSEDPGVITVRDSVQYRPFQWKVMGTLRCAPSTIQAPPGTDAHRVFLLQTALQSRGAHQCNLGRLVRCLHGLWRQMSHESNENETEWIATRYVLISVSKSFQASKCHDWMHRYSKVVMHLKAVMVRRSKRKNDILSGFCDLSFIA